jgi:predicted amidohydrolase
MDTGIAAIDSAIADARDVRELARALGTFVLDNRHVIQDDLDLIRGCRDFMEQVRVSVAAQPPLAMPLADCTLTTEVLASLDAMAGMPDLAVLAFLRGLCTPGGALYEYFEDEWEKVDLCRGDPFPMPGSPKPVALRATPDSIETVRVNRLLLGTSFELYEDAAWPTVLVMTAKETLDEVVWLPADYKAGNAAFARVSVVFPIPPDGHELPAKEITDEQFFGLWPSDEAWDSEEVHRLLRRSAESGCSIALLPEVCLPQPDELRKLLTDKAHVRELPALVVAGSAHERTVGTDGTVTRSNVAAIYLGGALLMRHHKLHPFQTSDPQVLGTDEPGKKKAEWLNSSGRQLRIAVGRRSRLAVLICADALDSYIQAQLVHLGVNVLLVPAFTSEDAGFEGLAAIPNLNQGTVIVANGAQTPFAVECRIPNARAGHARWSSDADGSSFGVAFDPRDLEGTIEPL